MNPGIPRENHAEAIPDGWVWAPCPVCGSIEQELVFQTTNDLFGTAAVSSLRRCRCGMHLTNPQPRGAALGAFYGTESYYTHSAPGPMQRFRQAIRRSQLRGPGAGLRLALEEHTTLRRFAKRLAPRHFTLDRGMSLLDYGCGSGEFADLAAGLGLAVWGVEPDAQARAVATSRGLAVSESLDQLGSFRGAPPAFDRIVMIHVLEHVPDPVAALRGLAGLLAPGGRLLIAVPNRESAQARAFGEDWIGYDMPRHLWHFCAKSLAALVPNAGLRPRHLETVEVAAFATHSRRHSRTRKVRLPGARRSEECGEGTELVMVAEVVGKA
jgi:SAM-dependent methyltransferase